ncbi:hypothetical protein NDU88_000779 [Pleurodeles waltl]|uniref:Uncharacterized protein n=1 Tax=Pleurodeles waltl TaxID=8319 RepID=A0AAV7L7W5_PLEWA|nr:hypothetical protein NDU88_000779 [Pleurodeles waltl]
MPPRTQLISDYSTKDLLVGTTLKRTVAERSTPKSDSNIRSGAEMNHFIMEQNSGVVPGGLHGPPGPPGLPSSIEIKLIQILSEIRVLKTLQDEANRKINNQLEQTNSSISHLTQRILEAEQRVLDLKDTQTRQESMMVQSQLELEELRLKLDDIENRSRRSNLRFIGIPKELEATSSMSEVVADLFYK